MFVLVWILLPLLSSLLLRQWDINGVSNNNSASMLLAEAFHVPPNYKSHVSGSVSISTVRVTSHHRGYNRPSTPPFPRITSSNPNSGRIKTKLCCICVNCKWVTSCKAYHFVETKHEQPHMAEEPTFLPREGSPTINVNIRTEQRTPKPKAGVVDKTDDAVARMWKDQIREDGQDEDEGEDHPARDARYYEETGTIEAVNTNTTTTIEYDVVKCADFVLDKGCWVRNMPEEIKRLNPDFVPT